MIRFAYVEQFYLYQRCTFMYIAYNTLCMYSTYFRKNAYTTESCKIELEIIHQRNTWKQAIKLWFVIWFFTSSSLLFLTWTFYQTPKHSSHQTLSYSAAIRFLSPRIHFLNLRMYYCWLSDNEWSRFLASDSFIQLPIWDELSFPI